MSFERKSPADALRVAHLDHTEAPGGAEIALAKMVASAGWLPSVFVPALGDSVGSPFVAQGVATIRVGPGQPPGAAKSGLIGAAAGTLRLFGSFLALAANSTFRSADVVHTNSSRAALYGSVAAKVFRKPLVIHLRDMVTVESLGKFGYLAFTRLSLSLADAVVANSEATLRSAATMLPHRTTAHVVPSPVAVPPPILGVPKEQGRLGTVGYVARLTPWKGQALLLRAFAQTFKGTSVRLRLVGAATLDDGEYASQLLQLADDLGISDQVDLVGHKEDVYREIEQMDVCVQCSLTPEPLGQNVLQYLAMGKAVIASDEGGPSEWITNGQNGLLFSARDVDSLATALAALNLDSDLRTHLAAGARLTKIPSPVDVAASMLEVYTGVLSAVPKRRSWLGHRLDRLRRRNRTGMNSE